MIERSICYESRKYVSRIVIPLNTTYHQITIHLLGTRLDDRC